MNAKKRKLLLILPRGDRSYFGKVSSTGKAGFIRLGLPTIAALTPDDWDVEIHDCRVSPANFDQKVDVVGITGFTNEIPYAYSVADGFRAKGVTVIMGGVHVSALPDEALQHADAVVIGEAEAVWEPLLRDYEKGELKERYKAKELPEMGGWPIPRRDLLDRKMYVSGFNSMQATRGCPFDCDYCAVTAFFGKQFRTRPIDEVLAEIEKFDTKHFFFLDDNITGQPAYAKELFKRLKPMKRTWGSQTSIVMAKDKEMLDLYAGCGGKYAFIGFESLSKETLKNVNKSWNSPDSFPVAIQKIHDAGINIIASFVFGLDGDDPSVFESTFEFVMKNNIAAAQYHILTPLPGTVLYNQFKKDERITDTDWAKYHTGEVVFKPKGMTPDELLEGFHWIYHKTYSIKNIAKRCLRNTTGLPFRIAANVSYRKKAKRMPPVGPEYRGMTSADYFEAKAKGLVK